MRKELDEERELATELDLMEYRMMPVSALALAIIERTAWGQRVQAQREALVAMMEEYEPNDDAPIPAAVTLARKVLNEAPR